MVSELHDFIIWYNVRKRASSIIQDLQAKFDIRQVYQIEWSHDYFSDNLRRFYGKTLPDPIRKTELCGTGPFYLILFYDQKPNYGKRGTSLGKQLVNTNVYDEKRKYRRKLGGDFPVHGSIHEIEANHDCVLLLGKNLDDIKQELPTKWGGKIVSYKKDLVGSRGWETTKEFFYVLNSMFNYVILRNYEGILENLYSEKHPDLDILTDDIFHIPFVINQQFSSMDCKKGTFVKIEDKKIHVDIHHVKEGYYDENWCNDILKNRVLSKDGFFVPDLKNYFYSLLYHCLIHKPNILTEYTEKLVSLGHKIDLKNISKETFTEKRAKKILDDFMHQKGYQYTNSFKYKLTHNELSRLTNVAIYTAKKEGISTLLRAIKKKLKQKF